MHTDPSGTGAGVSGALISVVFAVAAVALAGGILLWRHLRRRHAGPHAAGQRPGSPRGDAPPASVARDARAEVLYRRLQAACEHYERDALAYNVEATALEATLPDEVREQLARHYGKVDACPCLKLSELIAEDSEWALLDSVLARLARERGLMTVGRSQPLGNVIEDALFEASEARAKRIVAEAHDAKSGPPSS